MQVLSALFAIFAAGFGVLAFFVPGPSEIRHIDNGFINPNIPKPEDDLDRFTKSLRNQGTLGLAAGLCAAISAVLQLLDFAK